MPQKYEVEMGGTWFGNSRYSLKWVGNGWKWAVIKGGSRGWKYEVEVGGDRRRKYEVETGGM